MEKDQSGGFETRAIHLGRDFVSDTGAVTPPVWLTSTFEYGNPNGFDYTRSGNPNFRLLDRVVASLEGAAWSTCFGSGVSAITAVDSTLKSGDLVVAEIERYDRGTASCRLVGVSTETSAGIEEQGRLGDRHLDALLGG